MSGKTCMRCLKVFKYPYLLKKHNERKFPCKVVENEIRIKTNLNQPKPTQTNLNQPKPTSKNKEIINYDKSGDKHIILCDKNVICEYCNKEIHKNMINRHYRKGCLKIPKSVKNRIIEKYEKNKNHIKSLELKKKNDINQIINSNNVINSNVNSNNITNNNITIKINPLGEENTDFLKKNDIINIIDKCYMAIPDLIKKIHSRPENMNFYIPNLNKKEMAYLSKNNEIEYNDYDDICEKIISKNIERLDSYFYQFEKELKNHIKKRMKNVMKENNNEELNEKYMKNIKYYLMNISKKNKYALNKFIENIQNHINFK